MNKFEVRAVPESYKRAVATEKQGTLTEVSYRVSNYVNEARQFVTNQAIDALEVGREIVEGEAITKYCHVYLPPGYDQADESTKYDVLYLLHGVGGDHFEWLRGSGISDDRFIICNILDNLIANGELEPLIVVFPNGRSAYNWSDSSFNFAGTNLLGFYYFDYELRYDLIPFIEASYHTNANIADSSVEGIAYNRMHRAVAGLSMGGMQALNLIIGGYRHDSLAYIDPQPGQDIRLEPTVAATGMLDLFGYVGAFSNAPTSSEGSVLGRSIHTSGYPLPLLYMTCGDADEISIQFYERSLNGLRQQAGDSLGLCYQAVIQGGVHDFAVWNNGAYNFSQLIFQQSEEKMKSKDVQVTLTEA